MPADNLMSFRAFEIYPVLKKRLQNGYSVLNQETENHEPAGQYRCCGGVPPGMQIAP